jgi:hypothetical protein
MRLQYSHTLHATAPKLKQRMQFTMGNSVFHVAVAVMMLIRLKYSNVGIATYNH